MAKAVIMKTSDGVYLFGNFQCCNGRWFDAEGCFEYCQYSDEDLVSRKATKLRVLATPLGNEKNPDTKWYRNRENFIDIEIPYECSQENKGGAS